jgi:hypothetical protein
MQPILKKEQSIMGMLNSGTGMDDVVQGMMAMRAEMAQRESRMSVSFTQQLQQMQQKIDQARQDISGIVRGASTQIAQEARAAVSPVAAEYERAVSATSAHLKSAGKTVWLWFGATGAVLLLALLAGWLMVSWQWRETNTLKEEYSRYENAAAIIRAFSASDATLCGERICVNIDPSAPRLGEQRQYHQARPRPGQK